MASLSSAHYHYSPTTSPSAAPPPTAAAAPTSLREYIQQLDEQYTLRLTPYDISSTVSQLYAAWIDNVNDLHSAGVSKLQALKVAAPIKQALLLDRAHVNSQNGSNGVPVPQRVLSAAAKRSPPPIPANYYNSRSSTPTPATVTPTSTAPSTPTRSNTSTPTPGQQPAYSTTESSTQSHSRSTSAAAGAANDESVARRQYTFQQFNSNGHVSYTDHTDRAKQDTQISASNSQVHTTDSTSITNNNHQHHYQYTNGDNSAASTTQQQPSSVTARYSQPFLSTLSSISSKQSAFPSRHAAGSIDSAAKPVIGERQLSATSLDGIQRATSQQSTFSDIEVKDDAEPISAGVSADASSSLMALKNAVDYVCSSDNVDESTLNNLSSLLRQAMQQSDKITQAVLRDYLRKVQAAQSMSATKSPHNAGNQSSNPAIANRHRRSSSAASTKSGAVHQRRRSSGADMAKIVEDMKSIDIGNSAKHPYDFTAVQAMCSICDRHAAEDPFMLIECEHVYCSDCLYDWVMQRVNNKQAVNMSCCVTGCGSLIGTADVQQLLSSADFDSYLEATLLSYIEQESSTVICPNPQCSEAISIEQQGDIDVPEPMTEMDDDGHSLTPEAYVHFREYRLRCRACSTVFCANCASIPYHKGVSCQQHKTQQATTRHCRFCDTKIDRGNEYRVTSNNNIVSCNDGDCITKAEVCCPETLQCGCPCNGIAGEQQCLPCLKHDLKINEDFCSICYTETLDAAPCIQLHCKHVYHYQCMRAKLEARWPSARISFEFLSCGECRTPVESHPALDDLLNPLLQLKATIEEKAMKRLIYEGRDRDPAIINPTGQYYNEPLAFALHIYVFYECHTCKLPYFGGGYQCQSEANFDPAELICSKCQPNSTEQECAKHGTDWIVHKCRFCCNISQWWCWGNTHFCTECHRTGTWQTLVEFRKGKNKRKLWEYTHCVSLRQVVQQIGSDVTLSHNAKNEAISNLMSDARVCPLKVSHPPSGVEFCLGCSLCTDEGAFGNVLAERAVDEANAKLRLQAVKNELVKAGRKTFTYKSDFDENGIFYYLGTCARQSAWTNPAERGFVRCSTSGLTNDSMPISYIVGRETVRLVTPAVRNAWMSIELVDMVCAPTAYSLKHYSSWDTECLRNWVLEGSMNGISWNILSAHKNDESLNGKGGTATWQLPQPAEPRAYRFFRIIATGRNSNNNHYCACSGIELYGHLMYHEPPSTHSPHKQARQAGIGIQCVKRCSPSFDFDTNGLLYFLGTNQGTSQWSNPAINGHVRVFASSLVTDPPASTPASAIVGRDVVRCVTQSRSNQYFLIDFNPVPTRERPNPSTFRRVRATHYSLRHYSSHDLEALRNWRLEGSNDGLQWHTLANHRNDTSLNKKGSSYTWKLQDTSAIFQLFRVIQYDRNSNGHNFLALSGIELYGELYESSEPIAYDLMSPQILQQIHQQHQQQLQRQQAAPPSPNRMLQPSAASKLLSNDPAAKQPLIFNQLPGQPTLHASQQRVQPPPIVAVVSRYTSDFDENGIMFWLGSNGKRQTFVNPAEAGLVHASSSPLNSGNNPSQPVSAICGRNTVRCVTIAKQGMWMQIDLVDRWVTPTHYTLRHYSSWDAECLRNWNFSGSVDGNTWELLRQHVNDERLQGIGSTATWRLNVPPNKRYRAFRIQQTGPNSNGNSFLACSGIELYGTLYEPARQLVNNQSSDSRSQSARNCPVQLSSQLGASMSAPSTPQADAQSLKFRSAGRDRSDLPAGQQTSRGVTPSPAQQQPSQAYQRSASVSYPAQSPAAVAVAHSHAYSSPQYHQPVPQRPQQQQQQQGSLSQPATPNRSNTGTPTRTPTETPVSNRHVYSAQSNKR